MSNASPHSVQRKTAATLLAAARNAGWARVTFNLRPDGSVTIDAGMVDDETRDDFDSANLKMGG